MMRLRLGRFARGFRKQRRERAAHAALISAFDNLAALTDEEFVIEPESAESQLLRDVKALYAKCEGLLELIKDVSFRQDRIRLQLLAAIQTLDQLREDFEYHVDEPGHSTGSSLRQQIQELQTGLWSYRDVGEFQIWC